MTINFTRKEKMLIAVLAILLLGILYYRLIHVNVAGSTQAALTKAEQLQSEVDIANAKIAQIKRMEKEMNSNQLSRMGSYNNSKPETAFLHTVLSTTPNYSIKFDEVTRNGNQIRRNFNLRFTAPTYAAAKNIIKDLTNGEFRCMIGDVKCDIDQSGRTTISASCTFYETMVGGVEDSALPEDENKQTNTDTTLADDFGVTG